MGLQVHSEYHVMNNFQSDFFVHVQHGDTKLVIAKKNNEPVNFNMFWHYLMNNLQNNSPHSRFEVPFTPSLSNVYLEEETLYGYFHYHFINIDTKKIDLANLFVWHGPYELAHSVSSELHENQVIVLLALTPSIGRQMAMLDLANILYASDLYNVYYCSGGSNDFLKIDNDIAIQHEVDKLSII